MLSIGLENRNYLGWNRAIACGKENLRSKVQVESIRSPCGDRYRRRITRLPPFAGVDLGSGRNAIGPGKGHGLQQALWVILYFELIRRNSVNRFDSAGDDRQSLWRAAHARLFGEQRQHSLTFLRTDVDEEHVG